MLVKFIGRDAVEIDLRAIDSDEGGGTGAGFDDVGAHADSRSFEFGTLRSEVGETGGAADVQGALARAFEMAFFHADIRCPSFQLNASTRAEPCFARKCASTDRHFVATNHVDTLATPAGDPAIANDQFIKARTFDAVVIARRTNVADRDVLNRDAADGFC